MAANATESTTVPQWKRDLIQRRKANKIPQKYDQRGASNDSLNQLITDNNEAPDTSDNDKSQPQLVQKIPAVGATCPQSADKIEPPKQQSVACNMRLEVEVPPTMESSNKSITHLNDDNIKTKILRLHKTEICVYSDYRKSRIDSFADNNTLKNSLKNDCNKLIDDCESDSSEELQYGPGIVNKLKSKYLNLTLREMNKNRNKIVTKFRRAASLEDLLDCEEDDSNKRKFVKKQQNESIERYRNVKRGNESMKRARSVETLMRYQCDDDKLIKKLPINEPVNDHIVLIDRTIVKIESKLMNNERKPMNKPKRLKPLLDDTERPPQDLVKTTMKLFESSVKKIKPKGDVAVKIATFKTINDTFKAQTMKKIVPKPPVQPKPLVNGNSVGFVRKIATKLQDERVEIDEGIGSVSSVVSKFQQIERARSPSASPEPTRVKSPAPSPEPVLRPKAASPEPLARVKDAVNVPIAAAGAEEAKDGDDGERMKEDGIVEVCVAKTAEEAKDETNGFNEVCAEVCDKVEEEAEVKVEKVAVASPKGVDKDAKLGRKKCESPKQIGIIRPIVTVKSQLSQQQSLSNRELEKNLINRVKSIEQPSKVVVSLKSSEDVKIGGKGSVDSSDGGTGGSGGSGGLWDSKPWNQQNNTMIFNFSNRKDVPDYIENDGLIIRRKKEKPKAGDGGIMALDATLDASTTDDSDWEISGGPPSPCDVSFTNDNILINGRSNIARTPKNHKHRIQFNDGATRTFEYPSEASMLEDDGTSNVDGETSTAENNDDCQLSNISSKTACSMSSTGNPTSPILGGGGLASFTPSKVDLTSEGFELGITRSLHSACAIDQSKKSEAPNKVEEETEDLKNNDDSAAWGVEATADLLY